MYLDAGLLLAQVEKRKKSTSFSLHLQDWKNENASESIPTNHLALADGQTRKRFVGVSRIISGHPALAGWVSGKTAWCPTNPPTAAPEI